MIIYDHNKQFVAIDEDDLKSLGYPSLQAMLSEAADFADLFVKTPGHVHNFKNVHWIDFVLCATDKNSSKAIIHANGKSFSCILDIRTTYLTSSPSQISYNIHLNNLRLLTEEELQAISNELQTRPAPVSASLDELEQSRVSTNIPESVEIIPSEEPIEQKKEEDTTPEIEEDVTTIEDPYEVEDELDLDVFEPSQDQLDEIGDADTADEQMSREDLHNDLHKHVAADEEEDDALDISFDEEEDSTLEQTTVSEPDEAIAEEEDEYVFNIQDTADALEMDVATIEDFVNDFIMQAKEFKPKLYEAVDNDDMVELKSLSHQLKGVAANLRIADAQEILVKINKAENFTTSITDLDKFYKIISKLAGEKEIPLETSPTEDDSQEVPEEIEDALQILDELDEPAEETLDIADDIEEIQDEDALEIPEIDDDALEIADDLEETQDDVLQIDDFDLLDEEQDNLIDSQEEKEVNEEQTDNGFLELYDKKSVAEEIGLDDESFNELFKDYSVESQELIKEAKNAIDANDPAAWQHAAVKLKGMSDNMRIDAFQTDVEVLISTQDSADAKNIVNRIENVLNQILEMKD